MTTRRKFKVADDENVYQDTHSGSYVAEFYAPDWYRGESKWYRLGTYGSLKEAVKALIRVRA